MLIEVDGIDKFYKSYMLLVLKHESLMTLSLSQSEWHEMSRSKEVV